MQRFLASVEDFERQNADANQGRTSADVLREAATRSDKKSTSTVSFDVSSSERDGALVTSPKHGQQGDGPSAPATEDDDMSLRVSDSDEEPGQLLCAKYGLNSSAKKLLETFEDSTSMLFDATDYDGVFPRKPLAQFLPAAAALGAGAGEDMRAPVDGKIMPSRLSHVHDDRGENFVVEYRKKVLCRDGIGRRRIFYLCRPRRSVTEGSAAHEEGHRLAEERAWRHVEQVLDAGSSAEGVYPGCGSGVLFGEGAYRHHGDQFSD